MDMHSAQLLSRCGGSSQLIDHFCTHCQATQLSHTSCSWRRCTYCRQTDPQQLFPCHHLPVMTADEAVRLQALFDSNAVFRRACLVRPTSSAVRSDLESFVGYLSAALPRGSAGPSAVTVEGMKETIRLWWENNHLDPENIRTPECAGRRRNQLLARFATMADRAIFVQLTGEHWDGVDETELLCIAHYYANAVSASRSKMRGFQHDMQSLTLPPELYIVDILHMELRVSLTVLNVFVQQFVLERTGWREIDRHNRWVAANNCMAGILHTTTDARLLPPYPSGNHSDKDVKLRLDQVRRIFANADELVRCIISDEEAAAAHSSELGKVRVAWSAMMRILQQIFHSLRRPAPFSQQEACQLQGYLDHWCRRFVDLAGPHHITNYVHVLRAGHVLWFLQRYGSLARYCNEGAEASVRCVRDEIQHHTQHGGHGGVQQNYPIEKAVGTYMVHKFALAQAKVEGDAHTLLSGIVAQGAQVMRVQQQARRTAAAVAAAAAAGAEGHGEEGGAETWAEETKDDTHAAGETDDSTSSENSLVYDAVDRDILSALQDLCAHP